MQDEMAGAVALSAIASFGADAAPLHRNITSVAFCGAYHDQAEGAARIGFGHSSDHRLGKHRRFHLHFTPTSSMAQSRIGGSGS